MVALARINQKLGKNDQCQQYCQQILKLDKSNEEATYLLANLLLMQEKNQEAQIIYISLLEKEPDNKNQGYFMLLI